MKNVDEAKFCSQAAPCLVRVLFDAKPLSLWRDEGFVVLPPYYKVRSRSHLASFAYKEVT